MEQTNTSQDYHHDGIISCAIERTMMLLYNTMSAKVIRDLGTLSSVLSLSHWTQFSCLSRFGMADAESTACGYVKSVTI